MCFQRFIPVILVYQHQSLFPAHWTVCSEQTRGGHPRKNNDAPGRRFPIWALWFQVAQCPPSPSGVFQPGRAGLLHLSTTSTPSTARMYLINCFVFPSSSTNRVLQVAQKSYYDNITGTRHLWSKRRESSNS